MANDVTTWPQAFAVAAGAAVFALAMSFFVPIPWLLLAAWLEERAKVKATLAKARLAEAEAALIRAKGGSHD